MYGIIEQSPLRYEHHLSPKREEEEGDSRREADRDRERGKQERRTERETLIIFPPEERATLTEDHQPCGKGHRKKGSGKSGDGCAKLCFLQNRLGRMTVPRDGGPKRRRDSTETPPKNKNKYKHNKGREGSSVPNPDGHEEDEVY